MASIKYVLRKKANAQGKYPINLRIIENRKTSYISSGFYINEDQWDKTEQKVKKNHPNAKKINALLLKKLAEANDRYLDLEKANKAVSSSQIRNEIKSPKSSIGFISFSKTYLQSLQDRGKHNQYSSDNSRIKHLITFIKEKDILFSEIDLSLLKRFDDYLIKTRKLSPTSVRNNHNVIRSLFRKAIDEGIVEEKYFPYGNKGYEIKKVESAKVGLIAEEVSQIENIELDPTTNMGIARNMWLFSFYFAGIRLGDLLKMRWSDIQDERLLYKMGKNNKVVHLKIPQKAKAILDLFEADKKSKNDFIFPPYKGIDFNDSKLVYTTKKTSNSRLNANLKKITKSLGIDKKVTMHIARHSFGNIAKDKIPSPTLQKLYRHSNLSTTVGYMGNFIHDDADDALSKVVGE